MDTEGSSAEHLLGQIDSLVRVDYERHLAARVWEERRWENLWPRLSSAARAGMRAKTVHGLSMMMDEAAAEADIERAAEAEAQWRGTR